MKRGNNPKRGRSKSSLASLSRNPKVQNILKNINLDSDDESSFQLNPDADLLKPLQENLHQQLTNNYDSIQGNLKEAKEQKKQLQENREDIGYRLYNLQRKLANLHLKMKMASNAYNKNHQLRQQKEEDLIERQKKFESKSEEYMALISNYESIRGVLENLNKSVRDLEEKNQNKISDLAVMKRIAYKAEQDIQQQENSKLDQDNYINTLIKKAQNIRERIVKIESQIAAQREETKKAQLAVYQAKFEDDRLNFEREQVLKDWDSAVIGVKFRVMTLERIQNALDVQTNEINSLNSELQGIKDDKKQQKLLTENKFKILHRLDERISQITEKIDLISKEKGKFIDQSQILANQIVLKEHQLSVLVNDNIEFRKEYDNCLASANVLRGQVQQKEEQREQKSRQQSRYQRDLQNLKNSVAPLKRNIDKKKQEMIELQNEKVRNNLIKLTLDNQCAIYQERLHGITKEIQENNELIQKFEEESKENKHQIDLNLKMIEKMNKKYEQLSSAKEDTSFSPLEAKLNEIQNNISIITNENQEKQNKWIRIQTEFVQLSQQCEILNKESNEINSELLIWQRKVERSKIQMNEMLKDNQKYQIQLKVHQNELDRLNSQIGSIRTNESSGFDSALINLLQAKEKEAIEIENRIEQHFHNKREIEIEKTETKKLIDILTEKIKMIQDLESNFNRTETENELRLMRNEIRRLEESLEKIRAQQKKIVVEMQYALRRRENVKKPDYEKNENIISEGIKRLQEIKETKDEDSIISESLAKLQMMKEEPDLAGSIDIDEDQNTQNIMIQMDDIEYEIQEINAAIKEEKQAKYELQGELDEIEDVANEFEHQYREFLAMIEDQNRLNRNLQLKLNRMQSRTMLLNDRIKKDDPELISKFENVQRSIIDFTMILDGLCFAYPNLSSDFRKIQDTLTFD